MTVLLKQLILHTFVSKYPIYCEYLYSICISTEHVYSQGGLFKLQTFVEQYFKNYVLWQSQFSNCKTDSYFSVCWTLRENNYIK